MAARVVTVNRNVKQSFVPILIGMRTVPSVAGIPAMRKKNHITTPWSENHFLYVSPATKTPRGVSNSTPMPCA